MTDKQIIIDASKCEWRTGVEHCGNYECMLNRCCDYNCDWYKRRKLEQQLKAKEQECEELQNKFLELNCKAYSNSLELDQFKQTLTEIKEIINNFAKQDILTFPDLKPKENYKLIQKQCGEPIIKILQKISECEGKND